MIWGQLLGVMRSRAIFVRAEQSRFGKAHWKFWVHVSTTRARWRQHENTNIPAYCTIMYPDRVSPIIPKLHPGEMILLGGEIHPWVMGIEKGEPRAALYVFCSSLCRVDDPVIRGNSTSWDRDSGKGNVP